MVSRVKEHPRVLLLIQYSLFGGTRTYAKQLINFYSKHQFDTVVLASGPLDPDMLEHCKSHAVELHHYDDVVVGNPGDIKSPWDFLDLKKERGFLDAFISRGQFDIIVASVGTPGLFLGHMGRGRRSIYVLHTYPSAAETKLQRLSRGIICTLRTPRDIYFLTVSKFSRKRMLEAWGLWLLKHDISVIYNSSGPVLMAQKTRGQFINVLTIGHVVEYKSPMLWIDAAAIALQQISNLRFVWVGPESGAGPSIEACRQRVVNLGLEKQIIFAGETREVAKYYKACDIYVQPSRIENLCMSALDAMRFGLPCIVSNVGGMPELVLNGESGWVVDISEPHELANRILQLAKSISDRKAMGKRGQEIYAERFNPDKWDRDFLLLNEKVLSDGLKS